MSSNLTQPNKPIDEIIPHNWPGAFGLFKHSRAVMQVSISTFILLFILDIAVAIIPSLVEEKSMVFYVLNILTGILGVWFGSATIVALLASAKQRSISLNESLQSGLAMFGNYFLQSLLIGLIAIVSVLCLVVPAFIILPRLALAQFYLFDAKLSIVESLKASWHATRGHVSKIWGIFGITILMAVLFVTIVGIPVAFYLLFMYSAAYAVLYVWLQKHSANTTKVLGSASQHNQHL